MMRGPDHHMMIGGQPRNPDTHQQAFGEIEWLGYLAVDERSQFGIGVALRAQIEQRYVDRVSGTDLLPLTIITETREQNRVAFHHFPHRCPEQLDVKQAAELQL